ncbi:hypothetical protein [Micromonospora cathayae]|uniref:ADP-ribosyltransferase exoenzyme n=1 Tax=Micromonospora cathayae TaxID=3028804 RepID=A0ABY7ZLH1_9ACTN|nr:hypothetical protein [Micromonospora sp. HUAS 3]WDZ83732.1 hypothetical protein PVK37_25200 [Micromonospora sp. HUAS 3]
MGIRNALRRHPPAGAILRHTVGNAVVLHARDRISPAARSLALAVPEDPDHDIVVLDLHDDLPAGIWASVAAALTRPRRGIRLVVCGAPADTGALAGQWLCDRLRRPVVTPHGRTVQATAGTLFTHTTEGSGWVRYRPGRAPVWESRRYPAPAWDAAAAHFVPTSAAGAVEPIPGGVWIRDTRDPTVVSSRWQWLASAVPCQPDAMTVVLGCPGTPPLALDDVARFWRGLAPSGRRHARFVQYGPVQLPAGEQLGQRLADVLESPVVCFGGLPVAGPDGPRLHTVTPDGRLGWRVLVRELGFTPRSSPGAAAGLPRILDHRAPALLGDRVGPLTHRYTDDAVVEIVQSGLWIRAAETPRHAGRVRARPADPARHAIVVDDTHPDRVPRLREIAEDLAARLDPATRDRSTLHLASAVATGRPGRSTSTAARDHGDGTTQRFTAADLALDERIDVAPPPVGARTGLAAPGPRSPSWLPATPPVGGTVGPTAMAFLAATVAPTEPPGIGPSTPVAPSGQVTVSAPVAPSGPVAPSAPVVAALLGPAAGRPGRRYPGTRRAAPAEGRLAPPAPSGAPAPLGSSAPLTDRTAGRPVPTSRTTTGHLTTRTVVGPLWQHREHGDTPTGAGAPCPPPTRPTVDTVPVRPAPADAEPARPVPSVVPARPAPAGTMPAEPVPPGELPPDKDVLADPVPPVPRSSGAAQRPTEFLPTPVPSSRGLPASDGLDAERSWLRQRFSQEFDAAASSVARLLAEHPRLHAGDGSVADAVAVRLYLSRAGEAVDRALRSERAGEAVLFARCVAAGIGRLPSHRGATCLSARLTGTALREIAARRILTDAAFTHALTDPPVDLPGDVDVLLWSMTARRTRLLEPEGDHHVGSRVLFPPGTRFKVLETAEPGPGRPGRLLLRELSADEPVREHVPFDDLALTSLLRSHDRWTATGRRSRVGRAAVTRFTRVPGVG